MPFPIPLRIQFREEDDNYYSHNSGGEHFAKHIGDINDVQAVRLRRGLGELANLEDIQFSGGVRLVRPYLQGGGAGDVIGYGVISTSEGDKKVEDLWVADSYRHQGIAGYILGKLLTDVPFIFGSGWIDKQIFGKSLQFAGNNFVLPGMQICVHEMVYGKKVPQEMREKFFDDMPDDWSGIMVAKREGHAFIEVFQRGNVVGALSRTPKSTYQIEGDSSKRQYPNVASAAIDILNP